MLIVTGCWLEPPLLECHHNLAITASHMHASELQTMQHLKCLHNFVRSIPTIADSGSHKCSSCVGQQLLQMLTVTLTCQNTGNLFLVRYLWTTQPRVIWPTCWSKGLAEGKGHRLRA